LAHSCRSSLCVWFFGAPKLRAARPSRSSLMPYFLTANQKPASQKHRNQKPTLKCVSDLVSDLMMLRDF
jgi:hypothetical protein